ncbi:hypothetical protein RUM43_012543 [Polyplax serrata]|uniref:Uncharacterized protein n=1 Tax=Polyplax serrata TaxID=468196 RepID=A0AAN8PTU9_POLSC
MNFYETAVIANKQTSPRKTAGSVGGQQQRPGPMRRRECAGVGTEVNLEKGFRKKNNTNRKGESQLTERRNSIDKTLACQNLKTGGLKTMGMPFKIHTQVGVFVSDGKPLRLERVREKERENMRSQKRFQKCLLVKRQGVVLSVKDRNHMDVAKGPERRQQTATEDRREVERKGERQIRQGKCGEEGRGNQERRDGMKRRQLERF